MPSRGRCIQAQAVRLVLGLDGTVRPVRACRLSIVAAVAMGSMSVARIGVAPNRAAAMDRTPQPHPTSSTDWPGPMCRSNAGPDEALVVDANPVPKAVPGSRTVGSRGNQLSDPSIRSIYVHLRSQHNHEPLAHPHRVRMMSPNHGPSSSANSRQRGFGDRVKPAGEPGGPLRSFCAGCPAFCSWPNMF